MSRRRTVVVGHLGQDGRLLLDRLGRRGDAWLGVDRGVTALGEGGEQPPVSVHDRAAVAELVRDFRPDEIYYLAAHHRSSEARKDSGEVPTDLLDALRVNVEGPMAFLEAMRRHAPAARLFHASSSLIFGVRSAGEAQDEETPPSPACEYGMMKALAMKACRAYRERSGLFVSCGILYNHESALRPPDFLSQKVVRSALRIQAGSAEKLILGDLDAVVDWSYAPDFVDAFLRILSLDRPSDFVVASGEGHSVRELVSEAFGALELDWRDHVREEPSTLSRRASVRIGNARRLREATGWRPSCDFRAMVRRLVEETRQALAAKPV